MNDGTWGHCKHCRFFASPARAPLGGEEARCLHPELSRYTLTVYGSCGCNGFDLRPGLPDDAERPRLAVIPTSTSPA